MEEVEAQLPNGFHDGVLRHLAIDYGAATLTLDVKFWIGEVGTDTAETYRLGRVTVSGVAFLAIDPPLEPSIGPLEGTIIDGGSGTPSTRPITLPRLPSDASLYSFFLDPGQTFIRFAARAATLEWLS